MINMGISNSTRMGNAVAGKLMIVDFMPMGINPSNINGFGGYRRIGSWKGHIGSMNNTDIPDPTRMGNGSIKKTTILEFTFMKMTNSNIDDFVGHSRTVSRKGHTGWMNNTDSPDSSRMRNELIGKLIIPDFTPIGINTSNIDGFGGYWWTISWNTKTESILTGSTDKPNGEFKIGNISVSSCISSAEKIHAHLHSNKDVGVVIDIDVSCFLAISTKTDSNLTGSTDMPNGEIKIGNISVSSCISRIKKIQPDHTDKDTIDFLPAFRTEFSTHAKCSSDTAISAHAKTGEEAEKTKVEMWDLNLASFNKSGSLERSPPVRACLPLAKRMLFRSPAHSRSLNFKVFPSSSSLTSSLRLRQAFGVLTQHRREVLEQRQELSGKLGVRAAEARTLSTGSFASRPNSRPLSLVVLLTRCCALLSLPDSPAGGQVFLRGSKRCC